MPGLIDDYVTALSAELAFDRDLARRVCDEVAAHLEDAAAAAAEQGGGLADEDAARCAIARFGDLKVVAVGFAAAALPQRVASTWRVVGVATLAILVTMRLRAMLVPAASAGAFGALHLAALVDRYAFVAALIIGAVGVARSHTIMHTGPRHRLMTLLVTSAGALFASTGAGLFILAASMMRIGWTMQTAAPLLGAIGEIVILFLVFSRLHTLYRQVRTARSR